MKNVTSILLNQEVRKKPTVLSLLVSKWFLLGILLLVLLFFLLDNRVIVKGSKISTRDFLLPSDPGVETVFADYLLTEPIQQGSGESLHPEVLKTLRISLYTVKKGDSLSAIAHVFGLNIDTIISFNNIKHARDLLAGSRIEIPNSDGLKYRVKRGDSLEKIARRFSISLWNLVKWNNLESDLIRMGQELFIPDARLRTNELNLVLGKLFTWPTSGRLTSGFGYRDNPLTGKKQFHTGIDLANKVGTTVKAAMSGEVALVGVAPLWGKYIILRHPDGFQTLYAHLSKITAAKGGRIKQGEKIGEMGNTGFSTGCHLHFTIVKGGDPVDPLKYLP